jgi:hypothetical protein
MSIGTPSTTPIVCHRSEPRRQIRVQTNGYSLLYRAIFGHRDPCLHFPLLADSQRLVRLQYELTERRPESLAIPHLLNRLSRRSELLSLRSSISATLVPSAPESADVQTVDQSVSISANSGNEA